MLPTLTWCFFLIATHVTFLWQKQSYEWEVSLIVPVSFRSWSVRNIFFWMSISAERHSIKWRVFLLVWHLETLREFLPLISLKHVTAAAEEVAALGLFLERGIRGLVCAGWLLCCNSHSSILGSDSISIAKADSVLISHTYIIPFPHHFHCPLLVCLAFTNYILPSYRFSSYTFW